MVVNDKQEGIWGQSIALPLSQVPLMFGQEAITLQIQINGDGFDVFMQDKHCVRLEHRKELPSKPCSLFLQFPSCDDYGSKFCELIGPENYIFHASYSSLSLLLMMIGPENWMVYRAWWGNQPVMAKGDLSGIAGVNSFNAVHPVRCLLCCQVIDQENMRLRPSLLFHFLAQTIRQWTVKDINSDRSGYSPSGIGTSISKVWWCSRRNLHCSNQYYLCFC